MSHRISTICKNPIIASILKNNGTLFGYCVRKLYVENEDFKSFLKDPRVNDEPIISCFSKVIYKEIMERDFHQYIIKKLAINVTGSRYEHVTYLLQYDNIDFLIEIFYIKSDLSFYLKNYVKELGIFLDIDSLGFNRNGISLLDIHEIFNTIPIPINSIVDNINNSRFRLLDNNNEFIQRTTLDYILNLLKKGWTNVNSKKKYIYELDENKSDELYEEKCGICHEIHDDDTIQLPCGHFFHEHCMLGYLKTYIYDEQYKNSKFKCPYCTKELNIIDIL